MCGAPTQSITQKYHRRCFHGLTSTRIDGALTRVPRPERELSDFGALLEFWASVHAIGMRTSPKLGWPTIRPGEKLPPLTTTEWAVWGFFALRAEWENFCFFVFLYYKLNTQPVKLNTTLLWHCVGNPDPSLRLCGLISRCQCSSQQ